MPKVRTTQPSQFAKRLVQLRKSRQLTQEDLAARVGLSKSTVAYYESAAKNPRLDTVYRFAELFGVSAAEFVVDGNDTPAMKPGPASRLEQQAERIRRLSPARQRMVLNIIDAALNEA